MIPYGPAGQRIDLDGTVLKIFSYRPAARPTGLMVLFHGNHGNAEALRDFSMPLAEQTGLMTVAPHLPGTRFPPRSYQRGDITDGRGRVRPRNRWTTRLVPLIVDWAQQRQSLPYWLWGFSAGAQFLSRVAAFQRLATLPERFVVTSPSTHVLPMLGRWPSGEAAPYGLGGVFPAGQERDYLVRYLERPVTLCIGSDDDEQVDPTLARGRPADRQGADRLARAAHTFDLGAMAALRLKCAFRWQLKIAPGVGHSAEDMLLPRRAAAIMDLPGAPSLAKPMGIVDPPTDAGDTGPGPDPGPRRAARHRRS